MASDLAWLLDPRNRSTSSRTRAIPRAREQSACSAGRVAENNPAGSPRVGQPPRDRRQAIDGSRTIGRPRGRAGQKPAIAVMGLRDRAVLPLPARLGPARRRHFRHAPRRNRLARGNAACPRQRSSREPASAPPRTPATRSSTTRWQISRTVGASLFNHPSQCPKQIIFGKIAMWLLTVPKIYEKRVGLQRSGNNQGWSRVDAARHGAPPDVIRRTAGIGAPYLDLVMPGRSRLVSAGAALSRRALVG